MDSTPKRVRFSSTHRTYTIEARGQTRQSLGDKGHQPWPSTLDDEVKDHPFFQQPSSALTETSKLNALALDLQRQLQQDPDTVRNPLTGRTLTRFGANYWKVLEELAGRQSSLWVSEKKRYRQKFSPQATVGPT